MRARLRWPAIVVMSCLAFDVALALGGPEPLRLVLAAWLLALCTGMSWVPLAGLPEPRTELFVGFAASLVIDTLLATALVELGGLSTVSALAVVELVCLTGIGVQCWLIARGGASMRGRTR